MSGSGVADDASAAAIAGAVAAAAGYLRLEASQGNGPEAALLAALARTGLELAEAFCGQTLIARGFEEVLAARPGWQRLRRGPVTAITGVAGVTGGNAVPVGMPPGDYAIDIDADGRGWVRVDPGAAHQVAASYTAGLAADWEALPAAVAQGMVLLIAHLFEHREGDVAPPLAVAALWRPYRRLRLAEGVHA